MGNKRQYGPKLLTASNKATSKLVRRIEKGKEGGGGGRLV